MIRSWFPLRCSRQPLPRCRACPLAMASRIVFMPTLRHAHTTGPGSDASRPGRPDSGAVPVDPSCAAIWSRDRETGLRDTKRAASNVSPSRNARRAVPVARVGDALAPGIRQGKQGAGIGFPILRLSGSSQFASPAFRHATACPIGAIRPEFGGADGKTEPCGVMGRNGDCGGLALRLARHWINDA